VIAEVTVIKKVNYSMPTDVDIVTPATALLKE
jgi:hypothetical protein